MMSTAVTHRRDPFAVHGVPKEHVATLTPGTLFTLAAKRPRIRVRFQRRFRVRCPFHNSPSSPSQERPRVAAFVLTRGANSTTFEGVSLSSVNSPVGSSDGIGRTRTFLPQSTHSRFSATIFPPRIACHVASYLCRLHFILSLRLLFWTALESNPAMQRTGLGRRLRIRALLVARR